MLTAYGAMSAVLTAPLLWRLSSGVAGEPLDPWQTLWGFWWLRRSGEAGQSPMFSPLLWWPDGVSLWFQTWDLPSAIAVWPLWGVLPDVTLYNLPLFASFPLSGFTFYLLCRELWGGRLGSFLAGCLYTFSVYHFAPARMTLHVASMQWSPLFFLGAIGIFRYARFRDAFLAGIGLTLATLASTYHLLFCAIGMVVLLLTGSWAGPDAACSRKILRRGVEATVVFALGAGWLIIGMVHAYMSDDYTNRHDSVRFSADLQTFFLPNAVSLWSGLSTSWKGWSGNAAETAAYVGYAALALAGFGALNRTHARGYLWLAAVGAVLSLGPVLHVAGTIHQAWVLPTGWLEWLIPPLKLSGMPVRFTWLTTFGVAVAAGAALAQLCERGKRGVLAASLLTTLALVEAWPRPFPVHDWPKPPILAEWSADSDRWAVLDTTAFGRALRHQMWHGHPMIAGYVTRTPEKLWRVAISDPVFSALFRAPLGRPRPLAISRGAAIERLQKARIRYLIVDANGEDDPTGLSLPERYRGSLIAIFEVPRGPHE